MALAYAQSRGSVPGLVGEAAVFASFAPSPTSAFSVSEGAQSDRYQHPPAHRRARVPALLGAVYLRGQDVPLVAGSDRGARMTLSRSTGLKRTAFKTAERKEASAVAKIRAKRCAVKSCRQPFTPDRPFITWCSPDCGTAVALALVEKRKAKEARAERRVDKAQKEAATPIRDLAGRAQIVMNRYCRIRDAFQPCISCDRPSTWDGQWHASHYKSRGANSALRFHLWNLNKSCSICNNHLSGNIGEYRPRLVARIGEWKVEALDSHCRSRVFDADYLRRLCRIFAKKTKRIAARMGVDL